MPTATPLATARAHVIALERRLADLETAFCDHDYVCDCASTSPYAPERWRLQDELELALDALARLEERGSADTLPAPSMRGAA